MDNDSSKMTGGAKYVTDDNGTEMVYDGAQESGVADRLNNNEISHGQHPDSGLHRSSGYTKDALPELGNNKNNKVPGKQTPAAGNTPKAGASRASTKPGAGSNPRAGANKNPVADKNNNKDMEQRLKSLAMRTMGIPKGVADRAAAAQSAEGKGNASVPLTSNNPITQQGVGLSSGGSGVFSAVAKKVILISTGLGTSFILTFMVVLVVGIIYTTFSSATNNPEKAMDAAQPVLEKNVDKITEDDAEKGMNKAAEKGISYVGLNLDNSILSIKLNKVNILAKKTTDEFKLDLNDINELYPPSKEANNSTLYSAAFYYKLKSLNDYYTDFCGRQVLDLPLLMITLKLESDDMSKVFASNLGYITEDSITKERIDSMFKEYFNYYYDWSNYPLSTDSSIHDMEILAQHMVDVKGIKYCTYNEEGYREYLKEFIEKKYYLSKGSSYDQDYVYSTSSSNFFTHYKLTEDQILQIASLCAQEQGHSNPEGAAAEASLMANKFEVSGSSYAAKYSNNGDALYHYIREVGWWAKAGKFMDKRDANPEIVAAVKDVLVNGNRTLPKYVNSHDCPNCGSNKCPNGKRGDICEVVTKGVVYSDSKGVANRNNYIPHVTRVKNVYGISSSSYKGAIFYGFPSKAGDPFSYKDVKLREKFGDCHYDYNKKTFVGCVDFNDLFVKWLVNIAEDDKYGYSQINRESLIDFDSSSLVYYGLINSGFTTNELGSRPFTTKTEQDILKKAGFTEIKITSNTVLKKGDILWTESRTEVYIGEDMTVGAHQSSNSGTSDGQFGDQTGKEISVVNIAGGNYWQYAYRYEG